MILMHEDLMLWTEMVERECYPKPGVGTWALQPSFAPHIPEHPIWCIMCCLWEMRCWICVFVAKLGKSCRTEWVWPRCTKAGALNPCGEPEIAQNLKITHSVLLVMLEHCSTCGLHLCLLAACATVIYTFNNMVSKLFMYLYVSEWLIALVS